MAIMRNQKATWPGISPKTMGSFSMGKLCMGDLNRGPSVATFDDRRVNFAAAIIILACSIRGS